MHSDPATTGATSAPVQSIIEKYGSIGASRYAIGVISLAVESRHGAWIAEVPIKPNGISKQSRSFAHPALRDITEYERRSMR